MLGSVMTHKCESTEIKQRSATNLERGRDSYEANEMLRIIFMLEMPGKHIKN